jgi:hypothetical protein
MVITENPGCTGSLNAFSADIIFNGNWNPGQGVQPFTINPFLVNFSSRL